MSKSTDPESPDPDKQSLSHILDMPAAYRRPESAGSTTIIQPKSLHRSNGEVRLTDSDLAQSFLVQNQKLQPLLEIYDRYNSDVELTEKEKVSFTEDFSKWFTNIYIQKLSEYRIDDLANSLDISPTTFKNLQESVLLKKPLRRSSP